MPTSAARPPGARAVPAPGVARRQCGLRQPGARLPGLQRPRRPRPHRPDRHRPRAAQDTAVHGPVVLLRTSRAPTTTRSGTATQMVFGPGYAGADDVVGHELTHGYVERTSQLFSFHQSGAINESVADTIGEIVDHRNPAGPERRAWTIGEDLAERRPAQHGRPLARRPARQHPEPVLRRRPTSTTTTAPCTRTTVSATRPPT